MKIITDELTGRALDWAVSVAHEDVGLKPVPYSTHWEFGGVIIETEGIGLEWSALRGLEVGWCAHHGPNSRAQCGPTPLVAAMRCYVRGMLGDEVDVPEEWL